MDTIKTSDEIDQDRRNFSQPASAAGVCGSDPRCRGELIGARGFTNKE